MEGIEFDEDTLYKQSIVPAAPRRSWAINLVMKIGGKYVKDENQALRILIIAVIIMIMLSVYNFFF